MFTLSKADNVYLFVSMLHSPPPPSKATFPEKRKITKKTTR